MRAGGIAEPAVEAYLDAVAAWLTGPRRARAAVVDELRDGLLAAVAAHRGRGLPAAEATSAALREFGPPDELAAMFAEELACARARGVSRTYLVTGPLVGACWLALLVPHGPGTLPASLPLICAAVVTGVAVLLATGRASRLVRVAPGDLLDMAALLGLLCIAGDTVTITTMVTSGPPAGLLATLALTASAVRLACSFLAVQRCIGARRALAG